MSRIELTGLRGNLPIGAMAAFGVLRICSRAAAIEGPKLCWTRTGGDYHAALLTGNEIGEGALVDVLLTDVRRQRSALPEWEQVKTQTQEQYQLVALAAVAAASLRDRGDVDWLAALTAELAVGNDGKMQSTPFDMSVARQKFLADARRLASDLMGDDAAPAYMEALFGPWKYRDDQHSLGWDPSTVKLGAFTYKAPTGMANLGVRAAVWLAFESLPLFPCFSSRGLETRGFIRSGRKAFLSWPVWRPAIGLAELATLLGWTALYDSDHLDRAEMQGRGVAAIYRSERFKPNQYMTTFRPPALAYVED